MAKKITPEDTPKADEQVVQSAAEVQPEVAESATTEVPQTENKQVNESEETNPHILAILKKFQTYESLYIDSHGGTYTPNTPAAIRGKAVLYKNPYFNELKNR